MEEASAVAIKVVEVYVGTNEGIDENRLNEAMWAACDVRYDGEGAQSAQKMIDIADAVVCDYLGMCCDEWEEALKGL